MFGRFNLTLLLSIVFVPLAVNGLLAQDPTPAPPPIQTTKEPKPGVPQEDVEDVDAHPLFKKVSEAFKEPEGSKRMLEEKKGRLWVNRTKKEVIVDGYIALDKGPLELFACSSGTKEHEAVVALYAPARFIHAALLAAGANPGQPVKHTPDYTPALGQRIEIQIQWFDKNQQLQKSNAKDWVRYFESKKPLTTDWVFAGSGWWHDETTGRQYYMADSGDVVCVSNFSSAMMDLPIESSAENASLSFEAFEGKIPPRYTPVRVTFTPLPDRIPGKPAETTSKVEGSSGKPESPKSQPKP